MPAWADSPDGDKDDCLKDGGQVLQHVREHRGDLRDTVRKDKSNSWDALNSLV